MVTKPTVIAHAPGIALAALGTLAFGAVLGPEAPVIALGSFVGVLAARAVKADPTRNALLSTAGSFSAISALFGGPLVAGVLLLEGGVGMGAALIPALIPGFVCAAIGYVVFIGLGTWGGLNAPGLLVPNLPPYTSTSVPDLLVGIAVGILTALLITLVRRMATRVELDGLKRLGMTWLLLGGGLAVGAIAEIAKLLGANSQDVLFSGQTSVPAVLAADSTKIVLILLVAKALAYAISLGCGFRGGPIFPAVFLGVAVSSLAVTWFDTSPTLALAVGAASGMAAQTRLLVAPLVFALLLDGKVGIDAIPAAVLASCAAWITMAVVESRSHAAEAAGGAAAAPAGQRPRPAEGPEPASCDRRRIPPRLMAYRQFPAGGMARGRGERDSNGPHVSAADPRAGSCA